MKGAEDLFWRSSGVLRYAHIAVRDVFLGKLGDAEKEFMVSSG